MNFQRIVDSFCAPTCVVSVERKTDGGYGDIRLVCTNRKYIDMLDVRRKTNDDDSDPENGSFIPNLLYTEYFPQKGDCIIRNKEDLEYIGKINRPWYLTGCSVSLK